MRTGPAVLLVSLLATTGHAQYFLRPSDGTYHSPVYETVRPLVNITAPDTGPLGGLSVTVTANASDADSGVKWVKFYFAYCPGGVCESDVLIATDTTSAYSALWTFPSCASMPEDRFEVRAIATDLVDNVSLTATVALRLTGRGC